MGLSRHAVEDILLQIQAVAVDFIRGKDRYSYLVPDEDSNDRLDIDVLTKRAEDWNLDHFPDISRVLKANRFSATLVQQLPKRLKWAACEKNKYIKLISRFRELNDALIDLADSDARVAIREVTRETNITVLHLHSKMDELFQLTKALIPDTSPMTPISSVFSISSSHFTEAEQVRELADLATFKFANIRIQNDLQDVFQESPNENQHRGLKLRRSEFCLFAVAGGANDRCEANYEPAGLPRQRVWIEWREYDPILHPI